MRKKNRKNKVKGKEGRKYGRKDMPAWGFVSLDFSKRQTFDKQERKRGEMRQKEKKTHGRVVLTQQRRGEERKEKGGHGRQKDARTRRVPDETKAERNTKVADMCHTKIEWVEQGNWRARSLEAMEGRAKVRQGRGGKISK